MATRQELHLEILNQEYSRFVKDQVLTEVQLNEIIDFFEDQHRLTRTCLIGTGIVCGLHLYRATSSVTLTPGVAVTTDGDLLKPGQKSYRYFSRYTPPDNSHYDPFYYTAGNEEKMLTLYRLLTEEEKDTLNSEDYTEIKELDKVIKNWVAILYLEYYTKDPVKCTPTNCDNLGIRQKATVKLLILSKEDMDKLIHKDAGETIGDDIYLKYHEAYDKYFTFPVIRARRVLPGGANALKSTTLAGAYYTAAKNGAAALCSAIDKLYKTFSFLIDRGGEVKISTLTSRLGKILATPADTLQAQYTYDFYKDVIAAYNELRETLYNVAFECIPNLHAFPKHIMLGAANIDYGPQPPEYRHQFYPSPAVSKNKSKVNVAITMLSRLKLLVYNFKPQLTEEIRIIPSLDYDRQLAERAIPFYYKGISQLAREWSYTRSLKGQEKLNLSYNADQYDKPVPDEVIKPLNYDIDPYDFFRVEGHIGKDFQSAVKELHELRSARGVPIDLVAVRLGDVKLSDIDLDDFSCQFEDLNTILKAFQAEMNCLMSEGTRFFSGFTANAAEPHINLTLYKAAESGPLKWQISDEQLQEINAINIGAEAAPSKSAATAGVKETIARDVSAGAGRVSAGPGKETLSDVLTGLKKVRIQTDICDQFNKPVFAAERIVKSGINLDQRSFGKYFLQALDTEADSVDNFVEKARNIATAANALNSLNEDEQHVVFEYPMQIIGNLNYMQRFIPASMTGIDAGLITSYRDFSQTFCKRLKAMHTRLEGYFKAPTYTSRGFETNYLNMLNNLGKLCCGNEKLEVILEEIEQRKAVILERLSFARFAEQHPGLEHKCGAPRGGTFVMVYAGAKTLKPADKAGIFAVKDDLLTAAALKERATAIASPYRDPDTFALYIADQGDKGDTVDTEAELSRFLAYNSVRQGSVAAESLIRDLNAKITAIRQIFCRTLTEPEQDVVIADFCLPYLCCSACPPLAFVIPRERKILALPAATACSSGEPIPFSLYSPKGAVIASAEAPEAVINGDLPAFDPAKVPDEQTGKAITFTLDGEPTSCVIVVRKPLLIVLSAQVSDSGGDAFSVTYQNTTDESRSGENSYSWKFNDGSSDVTKGAQPLNKTFSRKALAEQGLKTISLTVTVLDDPCSSTASLDTQVPTPPGVSCQDRVLGFISTVSEKLNSDDFRKRMDSIASITAVQEIYKVAVKLLVEARNAVENDDQSTRAKIISELTVWLRRIYTFKIDSDAIMPPEVPRVLEELLRVLLMLMLNLVRCEKELPEVTMTDIEAHLKVFIETSTTLKEKYPELDLKDVLQKALEEYEAGFVSQADNLKSLLRTIIEILGAFA